MAKTKVPFTDRIPDEPDGLLRINLRNRDGTIAVGDVYVEIASQLLQEGDSFGAAQMNLMMLRYTDPDDPNYYDLQPNMYFTVLTATIPVISDLSAPTVVTLEGITADDTPDIYPVYSDTPGEVEADMNIQAAYQNIKAINTQDGALSVVVWEATETAIPIEVKVKRSMNNG